MFLVVVQVAFGSAKSIRSHQVNPHIIFFIRKILTILEYFFYI